MKNVYSRSSDEAVFFPSHFSLPPAKTSRECLSELTKCLIVLHVGLCVAKFQRKGYVFIATSIKVCKFYFYCFAYEKKVEVRINKLRRTTTLLMMKKIFFSLWWCGAKALGKNEAAVVLMPYQRQMRETQSDSKDTFGGSFTFFLAN